MKIVKILFVVMCSMIIACTVPGFDDGVNEPTPTPINTDGWAEMPAKVEGVSFWEYCYHDKLPSNNNLRNYSFCFDRTKHCALWVAYPLHTCYTEGSGKRTDDWEYDPCCIADEYEPDLQNAYYPKNVKGR